MNTLKTILQKIHHKSYKAYKSIEGKYVDKNFTLYIDYVQGDPFASPSRIRMRIFKTKIHYSTQWHNTPFRKITLEDYFARLMHQLIIKSNLSIKGTGKSGLIYIDAPKQEILSRSCVKICDEYLEFRLSIGLPARGRSILSDEAIHMLCTILPLLIEKMIQNFNPYKLEQHLQLCDDQQAIRHYLKNHHLVCFIGNGSILPRKNSITDEPMKKDCVIPFQSPKSLEVRIPLSNGKSIVGMGIKKGITLIVGGGYHGKSTLLKSIERGVYNHIGGDGREYVITDETAYKIRSEDGRFVEKVNISPFINHLPFGQSTTTFSSENASGSTSQAANIIESLELHTHLLLIDEDTSATNFMIRDAKMQALVSKAKEPITPFLDKAKQLYEELNVSTILVIGGSGDYFDIADHVIMMDEYHPIAVTDEAKEISKKFKSQRNQEGGPSFGHISKRILQKKSFHAFKGRKEKVDAKGLHTIIYGTSQMDLSFIEQLVDSSQTKAIAFMIHYLSKHFVDNQTDLACMIDKLYTLMDEKGLDCISPFYGKHPGDLALPRKLELASAINRLRTLKVKF